MARNLCVFFKITRFIAILIFDLIWPIPIIQNSILVSRLGGIETKGHQGLGVNIKSFPLFIPQASGPS